LDGLFEYAIAEQFIESTLCHDLHSSAKKLFQLGDQSAWKPRARLRADFHEEIDIALWTGIASGH